jgi:hypothetical protein
MSDTQAPPPEMQLLPMVMGRWVSQSLSVAARLNVADLLADGPKAIDAVASQAGANADALYRMLRALASVGVFSECGSKTFSNTPLSEVLRSDAPNSMRSIVMMLNDGWQLENWSKFGDCILTGQNAPQLSGKELFEQLGSDPAALQLFQDAMSDMSRGAGQAVAGSYDFSGIGTLADIAGGHGLLLTSILAANPAMKGMLFERPEVIEGAKTGPYLKGFESRVTLAVGSFFDAVPEGAGAYMMKHILHDWSDELCQTILLNIRKVIPANGRLLLVEFVVPEGNTPHPSKWIDLEMMVNPGGRERTAAEWETLLASTGFQMTRILPTPGPFSIVEGVPA